MAQPQGDIAVQTLAMPAHTNANGDIFGGWLVSQMDLAASITAGRRSKSRVATVAIDTIVFHHPVNVGDVVSCHTQLLKVGRTSMQIQVEVWVSRRLSDECIKVTEGLFTFVAIDDHGRSFPVDRP